MVENLEERTLLNATVSQFGGQDLPPPLPASVASGPAAAPAILPTGAPAAVSNLYLDLLHRTPAASEQALWRDAMLAGLSLRDVARLFNASPEVVAGQVRGAYRAYLGREASPAELSAWVSLRQAGVTETQMTAAFLASEEFYRTHGGIDELWLDAVYGAVLGRSVEESGLGAWTATLASGIPRQQVPHLILTSPEGWAHIVADAYNALLRRDPEPGIAEVWRATLGGAIPEALRAALTASPEFAALPPRANAAAPINLTIAAVHTLNGAVRSGGTATTNGMTLDVTGPVGTAFMVVANNGAVGRGRIGPDGHADVNISGRVGAGLQQLTVVPLNGNTPFQTGEPFRIQVNYSPPIPTLTAPAVTVNVIPTITLDLPQGANVAQVTVLIDVDLNRDGRFAGAWELGLDSARIGPGRSEISLRHWPSGTFSLRARVRDAAGNLTFSAATQMQTPIARRVDPDLANRPRAGSFFRQGGGSSPGLATFQQTVDQFPFLRSGVQDTSVIRLPEVEPNNTRGTSQSITLSVDNVPLVIQGEISDPDDVDVYRFTVTRRTGVFFDIDAREIGLSQLDSLLVITDANQLEQVGGVVGDKVLVRNDDGYDFDTGYPAPFRTLNQFNSNIDKVGDSATYLDLDPGTYRIYVSNGGTLTTGRYELKLTASTDYSNTIPALNSLPGASDTLFLDFGGRRGNFPGSPPDWGSSGLPYILDPFDFNGRLFEITPAERHAIAQIWRVVAEDYAPFNINVSTNYTGSVTKGVAFRMVISGSNADRMTWGFPGLLGIASGIPSYNQRGDNPLVLPGQDDQLAFVFFKEVSDAFAGLDDPISGRIMAEAQVTGDTVSHEFGHCLGLHHYIPTVPGNPIEIPPFDVPLMTQLASGMVRSVWKTGTNFFSVAQDDLLIVGSTQPFFVPEVPLRQAQPNTFGFRNDDAGNTPQTARVLTPVNGRPNQYRFDGVITRAETDVDVFRFEITQPGRVGFLVNVDNFTGNLDAVLRLLDANGVEIANFSPDRSVALTERIPTNLFGVQAVQVLQPGTYFAVVSSAGESGKSGQYTLLISGPDDPQAPRPDGLDTGTVLPEDRFERNDEDRTATRLGALTLGGTIAQPGLTINIHPDTGQRDQDWFRILPVRAGDLIVAINYLPPVGGDLILQIFTTDGDGRPILKASSADRFVRTQRLRVPVLPGQDIFVRVLGVSGTIALYDLGATLIPTP